MDEKGMIKNFDMLRAVKERTLPRLDPELGKKARVVVGLATCGVAAGAQGVYDAIAAELEKQGLKEVLLVRTGCIGICQFEPVVEVTLPRQSKTTYVRMTPEKAVRMVDQHLLGGATPSPSTPSAPSSKGGKEMYRGYIMVCCGPNCELSSGRLADEFEVQIKLAGLRKEIQVIRGGCLGLCGSGPNVIIFPEGTIYSHVKNEDAARIVSEHLLKGGRVEDLLYDENQAAGTVRSLEETDFFQKRPASPCATAA